ncbi:c-type cytochrome [Rhodoferax sp.]|uniref:c-type cytochrome n=1 Tax=Rhodoferax sp. TaxID=50421 RepID=UPI00262B5FB0|nr:c-type cytochrome [Rhodoferax sp.]MDD2923784.1 c-type cytochrome [Rhodoferax sp.]
MNKRISLLLTSSLFLAMAGSGFAHAAVDAVQAQELMKTNKCGKCHEIAKTKTAPSLKKIAAKYKGKTDGEEKIIKNITTGPTVKDADGNEEEHYIIKTKDPAKLKNLAQWILSQ